MALAWETSERFCLVNASPKREHALALLRDFRRPRPHFGYDCRLKDGWHDVAHQELAAVLRLDRGHSHHRKADESRIVGRHTQENARILLVCFILCKFGYAGREEGGAGIHVCANDKGCVLGGEGGVAKHKRACDLMFLCCFCCCCCCCFHLPLPLPPPPPPPSIMKV
jgi:hypothetical protein